MGNPKELTKPRQLLVEGGMPENILGELIGHLKIADVQIHNFGGVDQLKSFLHTFAKLPKFSETVEAIGIIRDAETNAGAAFQSVQGSLNAARLPVPSVMTQIEPGPPRVGVFILPDNTNEGMIETLLLRAVEQDSAIPCVDRFFECLATAGIPVKNQ